MSGVAAKTGNVEEPVLEATVHDVAVLRLIRLCDDIREHVHDPGLVLTTRLCTYIPHLIDNTSSVTYFRQLCFLTLNYC